MDQPARLGGGGGGGNTNTVSLTQQPTLKSAPALLASRNPLEGTNPRAFTPRLPSTPSPASPELRDLLTHEKKRVDEVKVSVIIYNNIINYIVHVCVCVVYHILLTILLCNRTDMLLY